MKTKKMIGFIVGILIVIGLIGYSYYQFQYKNSSSYKQSQVEKENQQLKDLTKEVDKLLIDEKTYMKAYENVNKVLKDSKDCEHYWDLVDGTYNEKTHEGDLKCRNCKETVTVNRAELEIWIDYRDSGTNGSLYQSIGYESDNKGDNITEQKK